MVKITVMGRDLSTGLIEYNGNNSIMDALISSGIYVSAVCGGKGTCGKCKIRVVQGELPVTPEDRKCFSEEELAAGMRLSCKAYPTADVTIALAQTSEEEFFVLGSGEQGVQKKGAAKGSAEKDAAVVCEPVGPHYFGIDIGTTTLAISLVAQDGTVVDTYTSINHQRMFGADVISRIQASNEGHGPELTASIKKDLQAGMLRLLEDYPQVSEITSVVIAGNSTMGHLLMGYSCETLGVVPFTPVNIDKIQIDWETLFGTEELEKNGTAERVQAMKQVPVIILPGFSTFVGGDIASGLLSVGFDQREKPALFIDLGTNGEMAIGNKDRILVASTAAGPAFEAGNISCGMGSVAGAICKVELNGDEHIFETLGDKPALGICGTGVIEVPAELLKEGLLDETGLLDEDYFDDGFPMGVTPEGNVIAFEQGDVRQLQLAKAAVRGGVDTLLLRYGVKAQDIETVYLAGGFGVHLNVEKALKIGLMPEELRGRIQAVGNTSLAGAICYGSDGESDEKLSRILNNATEIDLSSDKAFQEYYVDAMMFEEEI